MATGNVQNIRSVLGKALKIIQNASTGIKVNTKQIIELVANLSEKLEQIPFDYATTNPIWLRNTQEKLNKQVEEMNLAMKTE